MIIHDVAQNSDAWERLRLGIPTSSCFSKIVSPTGKLSTQSAGYMHRLLAEWLFDAPLEDATQKTGWMERGHALEAQAVQAYEFESGNTADTVGFITDDAGLIGCSPDRLVGDDGLLEIKCPSPAVHVGYMLTKSVEQDYFPQLQGELLMTGRTWVDIVSYCPPFPLVVLHVERNDKYQAVLSKALAEFVTALLDARKKLTDQYGDIFRPPAPQQSEEDYLGVSDQDIRGWVEAK